MVKAKFAVWWFCACQFQGLRPSPDLARLRSLVSQEQFVNVARNPGFTRFIRRLDDGRCVCELTPKVEDVPDE